MFDFVRRRNLYYLLSAAILLPGIISLLVFGLKAGIEFTSGSMFEVSFQNTVAENDMRAEMSALGHPEAKVQRTGTNRYLIRTKTLEGSAVQAPEGAPQPVGEQQSITRVLFYKFGPMLKDDGSVAKDSAGNLIPWTVQSSAVSGTVSKEIGRNATIAVIVASIAILLYISWAFRSIPNPFRCGIAATIATMHDVVLVMGMYAIFGKVFDMEVNTMFITGLLTVIGFSVHDTIVVLDRIRENRTRFPDLPLHQTVNNSILQTLGRSINTSFTVILAVVALLLIGGVTIRPFLVVMLIGTITGTYSSIFVASQILVTWEEGDIPRLFRRIFPKRRPALPEQG